MSTTTTGPREETVQTQLPPGWTEGCEVETYRGACHCGKFAYEFEHPTIKKADTCNCSICTIRNATLAYIPQDRFRFISGSVDEMSVYKFGKKMLEHMFCPVCGTPAISRGYGCFAANLHCVKDVDIGKLELNMHDGAKL